MHENIHKIDLVSDYRQQGKEEGGQENRGKEGSETCREEVNSRVWQYKLHVIVFSRVLDS